LANQLNVAAATQRQALNAIVFLYRRVLDQPIEGQLEPVRAKRQPSPPVVMTKAEVQRVLGQMQGTHLLMAKLPFVEYLHTISSKSPITRASSSSATREIFSGFQAQIIRMTFFEAIRCGKNELITWHLGTQLRFAYFSDGGGLMNIINRYNL
jgi:hypothetical protein